MIVATKAFNQAQLAALIAASGLLDACFVGLYIAGDPLSGDSVLSAAPGDGGLEEPTADTNYARKAAVWGTVMEHVGDSFRVVGNRVEIYGDSDNPVTILGWFLASAVTGGILKYAEEFASPVNLTDDLQAVVFDPTIVIGNGADYGHAVLL